MQQRHLFIAGGGNVQKTVGFITVIYSKAQLRKSKHATRFLDEVIQFTIE